MALIRITASGIRKSLRTFDGNAKKAIAEYVWNGFDAQANRVEIGYETNGLGGVTELWVSDNGTGIDYNLLEETFEPFFQSQKELVKSGKSRELHKDRLAPIRGKNGVGRLTFFAFAQSAKWRTVFTDNSQNLAFEIEMTSEALDNYLPSEPLPTNLPSGTTVQFDGTLLLDEKITLEVIPFLQREFGWFLELHSPQDFQLIVQGNPIEYEDLVGDREHESWQIEGRNFEVRYVRWNTPLNREYSRFYYISSTGVVKRGKATTFNNKGDGFYHSIYITSAYFDSWDDEMLEIEDEIDAVQPPLLATTDPVQKELRKRLDDFLRNKRIPFLRVSADRLIEQYSHQGVLPKFSPSAWDQVRKSTLEEFVKGLFLVEPKIFQNLSNEQRKTFTHLLM